MFGTDETRLYLDGKLVKTAQPTQAVNPESDFFIGNVGLKNSIDFFKGEMRSVRITEGERYTDDFQPDESFLLTGQDAAMVKLIFDGSHTDGDTVPDLSGNGNDGRWESFSR